MSYQRLYPQRINWEDEPSLATPINQVNLNKMDAAIYGIDGRVVELDENKAGKNETFNTTRNGVVPKPTQADITNEKVLRADGTWVEQTGGGGGGGGHTYVDKDDNQMPPRGKAKFTGGLNVTDDSNNNRTVIDDNYEVIPWTTWKDYTAAQKAQHPNAIVTDAPDCDGDVEIENFHLAWSNPNPTDPYTSQNITLDTDDYDFLFVLCKNYYGSGTPRDVSSIVKKGHDGMLFYGNPQAGGNLVARRYLMCVSDTQYTFGAANSCQAATTTPSEDNNFVIPLEIYTFKKKLTAKIKAIAHDVSTSASKCMMSDDVTSVEKYITENNVGLSNYVELTVNVEYTCPCDGYFYLNATATSNRYVYGYVNNVLLVVATTSVAANTLGYTINSIFVRKGSKLKFQRDGSNAGTARFYALSSLS